MVQAKQRIAVAADFICRLGRTGAGALGIPGVIKGCVLLPLVCRGFT